MTTSVAAAPPAPVPVPGTVRRTHPLGLVPALAGAVRQSAVGLLAAGFAMRNWIEELDGALLPIVLAALALLALLLAVVSVRWWRLTYCAGATDLRVTQGLLKRESRAVPYERVQDVSFSQPLLPRLLGLVTVTLETGAGGKDEVALSYLGVAEAEALRRLIRDRREAGAALSAPPAAGERGDSDHAEPTLFALNPRRLLTMGLFNFSLAAVAALAGAAQQLDFLLPFDPWDLKGWQGALAGPGAWFAGLGHAAQALGVVLGLTALGVVGVVTGLVRTSVREWGFRLTRSPRGLRRRRGLLTRTDVTVPLARVQAVEARTGFLRQRFGWQELALVSLGGEEAGGRLVVAPFARHGECAAIAATAGFALPGALRWQGRARAWRRDRTLLAALVLGPSAAALALAGAPYQALAAGLALALAAGHHRLRWRRDGHAWDGDQFYVRQGWFAPQLLVGKRERIQSVALGAGPLAARHGYCRVAIGVAGARVTLDGVPRAAAEALRTALLESAAQRDFAALAQSAQTRSSAHSG